MPISSKYIPCLKDISKGLFCFLFPITGITEYRLTYLSSPCSKYSKDSMFINKDKYKLQSSLQGNSHMTFQSYLTITLSSKQVLYPSLFSQ